MNDIQDALPAPGVRIEPEAPACDWRPLYDKILVRRDKPKEAYDADGKIVVADTHKEQQNRGRVLAVGDGRLNMSSARIGATLPLTVRVGQEVLFGKHAGTDLEGYPDLVILREDELLAFKPV